MWNFLHFSACKRGAGTRNVGLVLCCCAAVGAALPLTAHAAAVASVTALVASSNNVTSQKPITLTASVTAGGVAADGTVTFCELALTSATTKTLCEDAAVLAKAQLVAGKATLSLTPAIGIHTYQAIFNKTTVAAASTSNSASVTVTGLYKTTTSVTAQGSAAAGWAFTATVVGFASQPPVLSGTVSFTDTTTNNKLLGTAPLGIPVFAQLFAPAPGSPIQTGSAPSVAGIGDFNHDGISDFAVVNAGTDTTTPDTITVQLGNGDGTFKTLSPTASFAATPCASNDLQSNCAIAVGDFDNDGNADLVVTSGSDNVIAVLKGDGQGGFTPFAGSPITSGDFPEAVKVADFNNDGNLDLAVANANDGNVEILLGNGDGTFTPTATNPTAGSFPFFLTVADLNGDGNNDLAVVNGRDSTISILFGDGTGAFTVQPSIVVPELNGPGLCPIVAADFNGDGLIDLAVADYGANTVYIYLGQAGGIFPATPSTTIAVGANPFSMTALDFNGDGHTDLAVGDFNQPPSSGPGSVTLLIGAGDGTFTQPLGPYTAGTYPGDVVTADFNGDGKPDLAIPNFGDTTTTILLNTVTQTATASLPAVVIDGAGVHVIQATYPANASFAESSGTVDVQGLNVSTTLTLTASPIEQMITMPVTFTARLAPISSSAQPTGTVTFYDQSLGGEQLGTAQIDTSGQAVFTTTSIGPGTHLISASYAGDANFPSNSSTNISVQIDELMIARVGNNNTTILPGTTVVYTLQVTPQVASKFLYNVSFSATGLPTGAAATFSPVTLAAGGPTAQIKMTVTTSTSAENTMPSSPFGRLPLALGLLLPFFGSRAVRKRLRQLPPGLGVMLLAVLGLAAAVSLSGCGGAGLFAARKVPYPITVTATEGTVQRSTQVPLAIQ